MADEQQVEEVVVTVVDDDPPAAAAPGPEVDKTPPADAADPVVDLKQQLADMSRTAKAARAEAAAARNETAAVRQEAAVVRTTAAEAQYDSVVAGLDAAETEAKSIATQIKEAMEAGDYGKLGELNVKAGEIGYRVGQLKDAKSEMDSRREAGNQRQPARQAPTDPVEAFVANRTEPTAKWLREHSDFILDTRKQNKLTAAHFDAVGEGLVADTPEYFEHVEKYLGLKKDEPVADAEPAPADPKPAAAAKPAAKRAPAAPVSPTSNNGQIAHRNEVRLTRSEADAATDGTHVWNYDDPTGKGRFKKGDPIGVQEFARRKREMAASGAYDRVYTDQ